MGQDKSKCLAEDKLDSDKKGEDPTSTSDQSAKNDPRVLNKVSEFNNREVYQGNERILVERLKKSEDEKAKLLEKISELENESRSGISKTEHDGVKKARDDLQKVHMLLVEQHTQLVSKDKKQQAQLSDLDNQLEKMSTQYRTLMDEINSFKNVAEAANLTKKAAEDKLIMVKVKNDDATDDLDVPWKNILKAKDQQIEKMKGDLDTAIYEKEATELSFQQLLNMTIDNAENTTAYLEQKVNEVHMNCLNLKDQLDKKEKQILELQKQSSSLIKLNKGIKEPSKEEKHLKETISTQVLVEKTTEARMAEKEILEKIKTQLHKSKNLDEFKLLMENELSEQFTAQIMRLNAIIEVVDNVQTAEQLKAGIKETKKHYYSSTTAKKNLHEQDQLLNQESRQKQAVTTKLKDFREEYNALQAKYTAQEKANAETVKKFQQDVQQLSSKIKQVQDQLVAEREKSSQKSKVNKKRRFTDMSEEETKALEQCLSPSSSEHKCQHCLEIEKRSSQQPFEIRLNFWKELYEKQLIVVVDTNIIIESVDIIIELLGCKMDGNSPVVYIPFIVTKELEAIKKDKTNRNPILSRKCFESSNILEKEMRSCTRIVEQSLASALCSFYENYLADEGENMLLQLMKNCQIVNFKQKDADDYIVECCISLKKSNHNIVFWSQDQNLRLKVLGHRILSIRTQEIKEMIEHGTKNPLRALMLDNEIILVAMGMLKNVPQELILKMIHDPKNALMILMEKKEGLPTNIEPDESNNPGNRLPSAAASLEDFNLVNLFQD